MVCKKNPAQNGVLSFGVIWGRSQDLRVRSKISDVRSQISDLRSQISDLRSQISDPRSQIEGSIWRPAGRFGVISGNDRFGVVFGTQKGHFWTLFIQNGQNREITFLADFVKTRLHDKVKNVFSCFLLFCSF